LKPLSLPSPDAAVSAMLALLRPVAETERVELSAAAGRVLAEDLRADRPSPALDVSAMDGYAVRLADVERAQCGGDRLSIAGDARAGCPPVSMPDAPGAIRIMTGAPVPRGADAVVRREDVVEGDGWIEIRGAVPVSAGDNIRRRGENIAQDQIVVEAGCGITPAVAGALATFGAARPRVYRRVRIAVLVTGDEVLEPGAAPAPWQLRDSNGIALATLLVRCPWLAPRPPARAPDDPEALGKALAQALDGSDALVIPGGVSMGEYDFVPDVLRRMGARVLFHKLPQRPGKPVLGAVIEGPGGPRPILALPGNPVSVMVTARRMLAPVLSAVAGLRAAPPPTLVRLQGHDGKRLGLWWHRPVRLIEPGVAMLAGGMGSGDVASAARSDGFIEIPPHVEGGDVADGPWPYYPWAF
jgi:molybdopterin molybdotransferase